tara:strand:+ start:10648 stop:11577 length:930 start_codon:yes stop_codon:yes gene_type:complete
MCLKKLNEKFLERNLEFLERQRPSESNIPRSGEVAKAVNCHILFIGHKELDVNEDALFESYNKNTKKLSVRVRAEAGTVYDTPKEVSIKGISSMEITHFYGQYDLKYNSYWQWVFEGWTKWDTFKVWAYYRHKSNITRFASYFSKMDKTDARMKVLEHAVNLKVKHDGKNTFSFRDSFQFSIYDIAISIYGRSFRYRKDAEEFQSMLKLCLDSLVAEGDLDKGDSIYYKIGRSAIKTLDEYNRGIVRHKDSKRVAGGMLWLTVILAISALIQSELIKAPTLLDLTGEGGGLLNDFGRCLKAVYTHITNK